MANKKILLKDKDGNSLYPEVADSSITSAKLGTDVPNTINTLINKGLIEEVIYTTLVSYISSKKLVPGKVYRITDYNTVIDNNNYIKSAGHQFDIAVIATSTNTLSEEAMALHHSGDTYFTKCRLSAWRLLYCVDNNTDRFSWASSNGKGVIYRMIDEFNNDCPYDFKNIQFKRYKISAFSSCTSLVSSTNYYYGIRSVFSNSTAYPVEATVSAYNSTDYQWCYTFNAHKVTIQLASTTIVSTNVDATLAAYDSDISTYFKFTPCHDNVIKPFYDSVGNTDNNLQMLNNIVLFGTYGKSSTTLNSKYKAVSYLPENNSFDTNCYNMTFGIGCKDNIIGKSCSGNIFADNCQGNVLGRGCNNNSFASQSLNNEFHCLINNIILKSNQSYYNTIFSNCKYIDITGSNNIIYPYVQGSNSSRKAVSNSGSGTSFAGYNSSGTLVTFKLNDIINS